MIIRSFCEADAEKVSALIIHTLQASNSKDYSAETISALEKKMQPSGVTESSLFNIFVLPEYQGKGVGRKIIETLEQDGFFLRAERVEVPASITGVGFYRKLGYEYKNGIDRPDEERLYRLEKNRKTLKQS